MTRLTVTEKEHWKERIERKIDKAIETLVGQNPTLLSSVKDAAREASYDSLGISDCNKKFRTLEREIKILEDQKNEVARVMQSQVLGRQLNQVCYTSDREFENLLQKRDRVHEDELLAESDLGQQILSLRQEKEELLDTVWLATSSVQIRDLWSHVSDLLSDDSTPLQKQTIQIESPEKN